MFWHVDVCIVLALLAYSFFACSRIILWFFGHPEVYVVLLPAMGIVADVITVHSRKKLFAYKTVLYTSIATGVFDEQETIKKLKTKNNFNKVLIGISGGIDSALTAAISVDALGSENVIGVAMPSKYNPESSLDDAKQLSQNLGITLETIFIQEIIDKVDQHLVPLFLGKRRDVTEENIQSRLRGLLLMALSNRYGYMVLATGNKSEYAVGYSTLNLSLIHI